MRRAAVTQFTRALFGGPFRWANEFRCRLTGHVWERKVFDGRGRRIEVTCCARCRFVDRDAMKVSCLNRSVRRKAAQAFAREIAR